MKFINDIRFKYYWTKGEKALKEGDYIKAKTYKEKLNKVRKSII